MLEDRRREILSEVQSRIKDVRAEGASGITTGVVDAVETSEADIQEDIEFALIQMKAETLQRINEALDRLRRRAPTGAASSAATRSARRGCARCPSPSAARTARRRAKSRRSASVCCRAARPSFFVDRPGLSPAPSAADRSCCYDGRLRRGRSLHRMPVALLTSHRSRWAITSALRAWWQRS